MALSSTRIPFAMSYRSPRRSIMRCMPPPGTEWDSAGELVDVESQVGAVNRVPHLTQGDCMNTLLHNPWPMRELDGLLSKLWPRELQTVVGSQPQLLQAGGQ